MRKLLNVIERLCAELPLDAKHRPHRLAGVWSPFWECHIEPDWLLIYGADEDYLYLVRTGSHSDLFE